MVRLTRIYTRTGDDGQTMLADGSMVAKTSLEVEACGAVDEANASIGVALLYVAESNNALLVRIQNDLFDLGADLATPMVETETPRLRITQTQVDWLEQEIDRLNEALPPLESFVLPCGTQASTYVHVARTIVRRAEIVAWHLHDQKPLNKALLRYLNRLSDLLFVLARIENQKDEILWKPGQNQ